MRVNVIMYCFSNYLPTSKSALVTSVGNRRLKNYPDKDKRRFIQIKIRSIQLKTVKMKMKYKCIFIYLKKYVIIFFKNRTQYLDFVIE